MSTNVSTESAREALRREHGVTLVTGAQEGVAASDLPAGVYGFTSSPALASPLFATRRYRNFEVHRVSTGPVVLGYTTPSEAARLTRDADEVVTIRLYPDAEGEASALVCISYDRIVQHRQYSVRNAEAITLHVAPAHALTA